MRRNAAGLCLVGALLACLLATPAAVANGPDAHASKTWCLKKKGHKKGKRLVRCKKPAPATDSKVTLTVSTNLPGKGAVDSEPTGISCGTVCSARFAPGTEITLTGTNNAAAAQTDWSGAGCSGRGPCAFVLNSDTSVSATFLERVEVEATAFIGGSVDASAPGAAFGVCSAGTCSVLAGDAVTLSAVPDPGYAFEGWSGDCTGTNPTFTFTAVDPPDKDCTATFVPLAPLTVGFSGTGLGTVTSAPAGINCPGTCTADFPLGTVVTLSVQPDANNVHVGWFDACVGQGAAPCTITINGPTTATADIFLEDDPGGPPM